MNSDSFCCPITGDTMADPVVDPEGNSYEREAITLWLQSNRTSPVTRLPLSANQLIPNRALRETIEAAAAAEKKKAAARNVVEQLGAASAAGAATATSAPIERLPPSISATIVEASNGGADAVVTLSCPDIDPAARAPVDMICVIDVSGSMGTQATTQNEDGEAQSHGLSLLDVVKHAVKTVAESMAAGDRLGVVAYSDSAWTALELTDMDKAGRAAAAEAVGKLQPGGRTNIWGALLHAMTMAAADPVEVKFTRGRATTVCLLTDGQPNVNPPRGIVPTLERYVAMHGLPCTINAFGFGYNLDSVLLNEIAEKGFGAYAFIPDAGMVGTIFINATANTLAAAHPALVVEVEVDGAKGLQVAPFEEVDAVAGLTTEVKSDTSAVVEVGAVAHGQPRSFVVPLVVAAGGCSGGGGGGGGLEATAVIKCRVLRAGGVGIEGIETGKEQRLCIAEDAIEVRLPEALLAAAGGAGGSGVAGGAGGAIGSAAASRAAVDADAERQRMFAVVAVGRLVNSMECSLLGKDDLEKEVLAPLRASPSARAKDKRALALLKDMNGQVREALETPASFKKWGAHYLRSLLRAHALQQCNNFKDPGVQLFGGKCFEALRDRADDIFCQMPPPKPSNVPKPAMMAAAGVGGGAATGSKKLKGGSRYRAAPQPKPVNMQMYHNRGGGCFDGSCLVEMADGSRKAAKDVRRGDRVLSPAGLPGSNPANPAAAAAGAAGEAHGDHEAYGDHTAVVECVVKTVPHAEQGGLMDMVEFEQDGTGLLLRLTPWHPVLLEDGTWQFPCQVAAAAAGAAEAAAEVGQGELVAFAGCASPPEHSLFKTDAVYDFVLRGGSGAVVVGGRPCVTFGHGLSGAVVEHPYFGTRRVVNDLEGMRGWDHGEVRLVAGDCFVKCPVTGRVDGLWQ